ncbi:MAG: hypothetical protein ACYSX0_21465 [Planctomycetota bacterium]|jgi:hypothetical protein
MPADRLSAEIARFTETGVLRRDPFARRCAEFLVDVSARIPCRPEDERPEATDEGELFELEVWEPPEAKRRPGIERQGLSDRDD